MSIRRHGLAVLTAAAALAAGLAAPALAQDHAGITGFWGRYFASPGQPFDPRLAAPPAGDPPLLPGPQKAFEARRAAEKAADEKGEPIAGNSVACLPDGSAIRRIVGSSVAKRRSLATTSDRVRRLKSVDLPALV